MRSSQGFRKPDHRLALHHRRRAGVAQSFDRFIQSCLRLRHSRRTNAEGLGASGLNTIIRKEKKMQVIVRDNNVEQALRALKKKMQREGLFREMKERRAYEKPSERRVREKTQAIARQRKAARKKMQREGLLPAARRGAFKR